MIDLIEGLVMWLCYVYLWVIFAHFVAFTLFHFYLALNFDLESVQNKRRFIKFLETIETGFETPHETQEIISLLHNFGDQNLTLTVINKSKRTTQYCLISL